MNDINQYCSFRVGSLHFGVAVRQVQEVIRYQEMTRVPHAPADIAGLINLRGQIVAAIDLRQKLGLPERDAGALPMNVVVKSEDGPVSLLVDEIGDVLEVAPDTYEPTPNTLGGAARQLIRGVHKLPKHLLLLLDTDKALDMTADAESAAA